MNYTLTSESLPPEGVVVDTISPGGIESKMQRVGNLWFVADGSTYVYYTPMYWRAI